MLIKILLFFPDEIHDTDAWNELNILFLSL